MVEWVTTVHNLHERPQKFNDIGGKIEDVGSQLVRLKQNITAALMRTPEKTNRFIPYVR
jgi:hypothetical protein